MSRIVFVLTQSLDSPSGLGRYGPLARELAQQGHEIELLALHPDWTSLSSPKYNDNGVTVHYVSQMHVRKTGSHKSYFSPTRLLMVSFLATWRLAQGLRQSSADIIQLGKAQPFNVLAARLAGRGRAVFCDCDDYEAETNRFSSQWQKSLVRACEDSIVKFVKGITVNTQFTQERYANLGFPSERIVYVPNGVERSRFATIPPLDLRKQWGIPEQVPLIMYVGTLGRASHPVDLLLQAFSLINQREPDAHLMLVGGGEDFDLLQGMAKELGLGNQVVFCGRVPPDTIPAYLAEATVTVDPVYDDLTARARSPLKLLESLALGVPVVTGDVGDRRTLLGGGASGCLVAPGDSQALAEGILTIVQNPHYWQQLHTAALKQCEHWYWDQLVHTFVQVYKWA